MSILRMLKDSEFRGGLVAGIPSNIMVAHKFGESKLNNEKQFHDCGIVYYPKNSYPLCVVMSRGENYGDLVSAIKGASRMAYEEVDSQL
ncbi:MAG: serine hydrolase [Deltaproteobacteria bacterium]|nr:serine hydrolase [Deltaproteobacteria bacterium]